MINETNPAISGNQVKLVKVFILSAISFVDQQITRIHVVQPAS